MNPEMNLSLKNWIVTGGLEYNIKGRLLFRGESSNIPILLVM